MRIITGTAKGKTLKSLNGLDTRPTTDKVKEAMFSAVQFDVEDADVLDLFAGSGQLGIESLSHGARKVFFNDSSAAAVGIIKENLTVVRDFADKSEVYRLPYDAFLRMVKTSFDIAFIDPPYSKGIIGKVLPPLTAKMNPGGVIICEHESGLEFPEKVGDFGIDRSYVYGSVTVTILGHRVRSPD